MATKGGTLTSRVGEFLAGADFGNEVGVDGKASESSVGKAALSGCRGPNDRENGWLLRSLRGSGPKIRRETLHSEAVGRMLPVGRKMKTEIPVPYVGLSDAPDSKPPRTIATGPPIDNSGQNPIVYVQAVRYKNSVTPEKAQQLLQSLKNTFRTIPQVKSVEVGSVVDDKQKEYDYAVVMRFSSQEDKRAYGDSEVHRRWVQENVGDSIAKHLMLNIQSDSSGY